MRRLYLQIYAALLGIALLFGLLLGAVWWLMPANPEQQRLLDGLAALLGDALPPPAADHSALEGKLSELATKFRADLTLRSADGTPLAVVGEELPAPSGDRLESRWLSPRGRGPTVALHLPDGRWLIARPQHGHRPGGLVLGLGLLALAVAIGAYPLARRITRRLERLQRRVDALGAGDLKTRVEVEGKDEVAALAASFNRAADRIEALVQAHKTLLASVSHGLRTPLTRMRMALELLPADTRPELRDGLEHDIAELDALIAGLLLASRLDALEQPLQTEDIDLLALAAEEAARFGIEAAGEPVSVRGEPRLLHHLVRNLLTNACRYAAGAPVEVRVERGKDQAVLAVADRGPGVPELERERIFEPFYRLSGSQQNADGAGLGLSLVRQIARRHGGEARCLARQGGGARFEVCLPATSAMPG
jgi:signal transduction histidine kinase